MKTFKANLAAILGQLGREVAGVDTCVGFNVALLETTRFTINITMNQTHEDYGTRRLNGTRRLRVDIVPAFSKKGVLLTSINLLSQ